METSTRTALRRRLVRALVGATASLTLGLGAGLVAHSPASAAADPGAASVLPLPDGSRPEGITSGPGNRLYVGSLADGRIVTANPRQGTSEVLLPGAEGRQLRGLYRDPRSGLLWAAGNVGTVAHVYAVDTRTGDLVADVVVPGGVFLNDLVVTRTAVWVTDSRVDRLTVIDLDQRGMPASSAPRFVTLGGAWPTGDGIAINANGIRALPDGSLLLNNSRVGGLWRVDPTSGLTTEVPVTGGPRPTGGDGLELVGSTLFNVRGNGQAEVSKLRITRSGGAWSATWLGSLTDPSLDVPSTATWAGGRLWAVNARFGDRKSVV